MKLKLLPPDRRAAWFLLIPLLLACSFVTDRLFPADDTPEAGIVALPTPTPLPSATVAPPTPPISPSATSASPRITEELTLLPAPLYFIGQTGQIMRIDSDGHTLTQITDFPEGILDFDVSPVDGRVVYVSGNKLIETGPDGQDPIVKVDAGPLIEEGTRTAPGASAIVERISRPRFSPDGGQIVFGLNGINLILAGPSTKYAVLLASDPYPNLNDPTFEMPDVPPRFYWPESWSPGGDRLLIEFAYYPEGSGLAVMDVINREWNMVTNADGIECCDWAWSADGTAGFIASDQIAYGVPGLAQVDPVTGGSVTIINGAPETSSVTGLPPSVQVFRAPFVASDGLLYCFVAIGYQDDPLQPFFHIAQVPAGAAETSPVRQDEHLIVDYLWAGDGRGAVIVDAGPSSTFPIIGPLRWLPVDGEPAVDLPAAGGVLRWGPS